MPITHSPDTVHLRSRGTGDITHNIEGIDEEFREFCPAGCVPGKLNHIKADSIGLGVVGSLVRQDPNNSVYLAPTTGSRVSIACHCNLLLLSREIGLAVASETSNV